MQTSIAFYTNVLDFQCVEHGGDDDPSCSALMRGGSLLLLSSHGGDGTFGQAIVVVTDNVDALFRRFRTRGLQTPGNPDAPGEVHGRGGFQRPTGSATEAGGGREAS